MKTDKIEIDLKLLNSIKDFLDFVTTGNNIIIDIIKKDMICSKDIIMYLDILEDGCIILSNAIKDNDEEKLELLDDIYDKIVARDRLN